MINTSFFKFLTIFFLITASNCFSSPQKEHEEWWTLNPDKFQTFNDWLGDTNARSRVLAREHVQRQGYVNLLDVPSGTCTEYFGYKYNNIAIDYTGLDITAYLVALAQGLGIKAYEGSIENMPFNDSSFQLVYIRHLLEHLDYYQKALSESIRVAEKEVLVTFFIPPVSEEPDRFSYAKIDHAWLYHNCYNKEDLLNYVFQNPKVDRVEWEAVDGPTTEVILHIFLKLK